MDRVEASSKILFVLVVTGLWAPPVRAESPPPQPMLSETVERPAPPPASHPAPRLKLSASGFTIGNLDRSPVPLTGAQLDVYPLSERWMRGGFSFAGGTGHASELGGRLSLGYGLVGLTAGVQYPGRVTPFIEGHLSGGLLSGKQDGTLTVAGTTISGASGTTWIYGRGIQIGTEVYISGRAYVSVSLGWMRTTWGAPDIGARIQDPRSNLRLVDITSDSLFWKVGLGI
jgi:hypothetical protein